MSDKNLILKIFPVLTALPLAAVLATSAFAVDLDLIDTGVADPEQTLIDALVGPGSNITVVPGSVQYVGRIGDNNEAQTALFSNFNLTPNSGGGESVSITNGVLLTTGVASIPASNTTNQWDHFAAGVTAPSTGANADLEALVSAVTFDQNLIQFDFTLDNPADTGVAIDLVFGSDEFPTQSVTDIVGFFVDGVNFAQFPSGNLIGNNDDSQFIDNPVGGGNYDIEYNGFTPRFVIIGDVDPGLTTHRALIAIADTNDSIFDSGAFFSNVRGTDEGAGIGGPGPGPAGPSLTAVPVDSSWALLLMMIGLMAAGLLVLRPRG